MYSYLLSCNVTLTADEARVKSARQKRVSNEQTVHIEYTGRKLGKTLIVI